MVMVMKLVALPEHGGLIAEAVSVRVMIPVSPGAGV